MKKQPKIKDGRYAVTVKHFYNNYDHDINFYIWNDDWEEWGDGWRVGTGIDKLMASDEYIIEWGSVSERCVSPDYEIYVSEKDMRSSFACLL